MDKAQPVQEPAAWLVYTQDGQSVYVTDNPTDIQADQRALPLYTNPPKRPWVGLTDADADDLFVETQRHMIGHGSREFTRIFTRLINAKLKEQNYE